MVVPDGHSRKHYPMCPQAQPVSQLDVTVGWQALVETTSRHKS
jgi:hypothetical protein